MTFESSLFFRLGVILRFGVATGLSVVLGACAGAQNGGITGAAGPAAASTTTTLAEFCKSPPQRMREPKNAAELAFTCNPRVVAEAGSSTVEVKADGGYQVHLSKPVGAEVFCARGKPKTGICTGMDNGDRITNTQVKPQPTTPR